LSIQFRDLLLSIQHQGSDGEIDQSLRGRDSVTIYYLSTDHETIWLPDGDEISDREKHMVQSPKLMLTFVWNPHGLQVVDIMPWQQERCSRLPAIRDIFSPILRLGVETDEKRLVVHAGKARPHTAQMTRACCDGNFLRLARYPHGPYEPDFAPSDFFLFVVRVSEKPPPGRAIRV
jgi:hypothetical protein